MLKALYGDFKIKRKIDVIILPCKIIYLVYTLPFVAFALVAFITRFGAGGNPLKE